MNAIGASRSSQLQGTQQREASKMLQRFGTWTGRRTEAGSLRMRGTLQTKDNEARRIWGKKRPFLKDWGRELAVAAVIITNITAANECLLPTGPCLASILY